MTSAGSGGSTGGTVAYIKFVLLMLYAAARILFSGAIDFALTFVAVAVVAAPFLWLAGAPDVRGLAITIGCVGGALLAVAMVARNALKFIETVRAAMTKVQIDALENEDE